MRIHGRLITTFDSIDIGDYFGFVYLITNKSNSRRYIGRKYFWSFRKPPGKKRKVKQESDWKKYYGSCPELKEPGKKRKVKQESDWKKYYGSCPELKEDLKRYGKETFNREIISLHTTKGNCNFEETKQLFLNNVLSEALDT
jgi:hypothetical protein